MADDYEAPRIQDQELNEAILSNDISIDFLPFIDLCHRHYADEVDLSFGEGHRRTVAKDTLQGLGTKTFNYDLKWTSDSQSGLAGGVPSISTALEEQLGLKLVPATDQVEVLVIDHIEKPTPETYRKDPSRSSL